MAIVNLTDSAATKVQELISRREDSEGYGLRVKVVGGGCSGLQYQLMFDNQVGDLDQTEEVGGVQVMVDSKSAVYLVGTTVDYVDELDRSGFKIENPNATNTCGCGESFGD